MLITIVIISADSLVTLRSLSSFTIDFELLPSFLPKGRVNNIVDCKRETGKKRKKKKGFFALRVTRTLRGVH